MWIYLSLCNSKQWVGVLIFFNMLADNMGDLTLVSVFSAGPSVAINNGRGSQNDMVESDKRNLKHDSRKSAEFLPSQGIPELCEMLQLPVCSFYGFKYAS